jgi:hypothetical protein
MISQIPGKGAFSAIGFTDGASARVRCSWRTRLVVPFRLKNSWREYIPAVVFGRATDGTDRRAPNRDVVDRSCGAHPSCSGHSHLANRAFIPSSDDVLALTWASLVAS